MNHTSQEDSAGSIQSLSHCGRGLRSGEALAKLDDALDRVRAQLGELQGTTIRKAREAIRSADESVHHHPYGALAAVAVTGLLVGFLATRR
ncbi:hypothetical protein C7T35_07675 [Variovorax sp. WS11]|uniref:DUF883 family protein n=1 Tax=Variovorax sp. WS11 TaxID=1105204 RepID=UPI000D0DFAFC|nr:DUF883 family protein [Variovorax sp. WS11]NDZ18442.1 DUF883 family protein [Variovorax sp. WS11]PSL85091.1 hypothetical protein C7T35_07675 [Variovorax sp. WS11]